MIRPAPLPTLLLAALLAACGGGDAPAEARGPDTRAPAEPVSTVAPTGDVVEVGMASNPGEGEVFLPANPTVKRGDVLRFRLVSGVHNANFLAGRNPAGVALPAATPYLQVPGQTHDILIDLPPGEYYFQCDPHVALGMVGTLTVTD
jgi:plastocyanin